MKCTGALKNGELQVDLVDVTNDRRRVGGDLIIQKVTMGYPCPLLWLFITYFFAMNQEGSSKQNKKARTSTYIKAGTMRSLANQQKSLFLSKRKFVPTDSNSRGPANSRGPDQQNLPNIIEKNQLLTLPHAEVGAHTRTIGKEVQQNSTTRTEEQVQQDSSTPTTNEQCEEQDPSKKRQRGRTQMQRVHARSERKLVVLNEDNQPDGPTKDVVTELSSFLGTLARNPMLCPLDIWDWRKMDTKEDLWEYTKEKYDIPDAAKPWVLTTISNAWRSYKCRLKRAHFDEYANDAARMANRPDNIPESIFRDLLKYWSSEKVQKSSKTNSENRKMLKNPHTVGKTSFAVFRKDLEKERSDPLTLKDLFVKTRARKPGRSYKDSNEDTTSKIAEMERIEAELSQDDNHEPVNTFTSVMGPEHPGRLRLYGRGVTKTSLKRKVGQFGPSSSSTNDEVQRLKELIQKMEEKMEQQKTTMQQEILLDLLAQLQTSEFDIRNLIATHGAIQPIHRPSVGSNNQGELNEDEAYESSEDLDLT